jgi:hypothetical protein
VRITEGEALGAGEGEVMTKRREPSTDYIRLNEIEDVIVSVDLVAHLAPLLDEHPSYWKWVSIGAHSALQGAMICALADSTGTSVLEKNSAKKTLDWLKAEIDTGGKPPLEKLLPFKRLLRRCTSGSEPLLKLTPKQRRDISRLHDHFRNNFVHFLPHQGWSIPKAELPPIINAAMDAVASLMNGWPTNTRLCERQQERLSKALHDCKARLGANNDQAHRFRSSRHLAGQQRTRRGLGRKLPTL